MKDKDQEPIEVQTPHGPYGVNEIRETYEDVVNAGHDVEKFIKNLGLSQEVVEAIVHGPERKNQN